MIFFIFFIFLSCAQDSNNKILDNHEFQVSYPSHLKLDESTAEGAVFVLRTELKGKEDVFVENINLTTKEIGDQKFNEFIEGIKNEVSNVAEIVESSRLNLRGKECFRMVFNLTENNIKLTFIQHYFVENKKAYVLTFSSESIVFDDYFDEMNAVLMSFKLK